MLKHLSVRNYVLIDQLEIDLSSGLTIITGETGAGKSILLGALGLVIGERADTQSLHDKKSKCVIEGTFDIRKYDLADYFGRHELDHQPETIIRREITPEGKSRTFINDTPVTLAQARELGLQLIDIHSQHEMLTLNESAFQLSVVDAFSGSGELLNDYRKAYRQFKQHTRELQELTEREKQSRKDLDYLQFQFKELDEARLEGVSQEEMEQELEALEHSEKIKENLSMAYEALDGGDSNLISSLAEVKQLLSAISKYSPAIGQLAERTNSLFLELKDLSNELDREKDKTVYSPQRIEELNGLLDGIYRLQQKHQMNSVCDLLKLKEELSNRLHDITSLDSTIEKLKEQLGKEEKALGALAKKLSAKREAAIPKIEKEIGGTLAELGMPNAKLQIQNNPLPAGEYSAEGTDRVVFYFTANKGAAAKELRKTASGGELSRLMLSLKALVAKLTALPTIIFDEIDTGVSGGIADRVGGIMDKMAGAMQVIGITHLPQIASRGGAHLLVYKEERGGKTFTRIRQLNKEDRIQEIAKMLSNENPTPAAIKNAKELLGV